ncbi:hypothetical protein OsJ_36974 [Oryza sativa Japonica Group]|uniref:Uncharacterized protein n=2 Tax=Oryza sativa subsp. japonica TaxID=39947 RepID=A0A8J8XUL8_ORYSJ|nr:hypothetical protein LOC_Os12g43610 [Oryza sativa Japonica Group]EAZ21320.1 hypothetical protein OsJ_36974 [Oryza sativa Japonica Group]
MEEASSLELRRRWPQALSLVLPTPISSLHMTILGSSCAPSATSPGASSSAAAAASLATVLAGSGYARVRLHGCPRQQLCPLPDLPASVLAGGGYAHARLRDLPRRLPCPSATVLVGGGKDRWLYVDWFS